MGKTLEIHLDSDVVDRVFLVEKNISKAVNEALNLWLKERISMCPITKDFCINPCDSCKGCDIISQRIKNC
jgi:hypothetical protein